MGNNKALGDKGEAIGSNYLQGLGFEIKEFHYRYKRAEIDLIAEKEDLLLFVEIKTRTGVRFGHPEEFVDDKQMALILEAADHYINEQGWQGSIRFDIISILLQGDQYDIQHFPDAFY
ncbi:MAG: YraN family protein [Candidatus Cyclobacteriaceae bacterium M3_2C_046]